jgi:hypothetical protein
MNYEQATQLITVLEDIKKEMQTKNELLREINAQLINIRGDL